MNRRPATVANHVLSKAWGFLAKSAVLYGCIVVVTVILIGKAFLGIASTTLSGWTALFFLSLFLGLITTNLFSTTPFASSRQMVAMVLGCAVSLTTLLLLLFSIPTAIEGLLTVSALLLFGSLNGMRPHVSKECSISDYRFAQWALRLDDLLKYDLPSEIRSNIVRLIDDLWQSPEDNGNFIPAQDNQLSDLLAEVETRIRLRDFDSCAQTLYVFSKSLAERNFLVLRSVVVEYQDISRAQKILK